MSSGYQQSWDPREGSSAPAAVMSRILDRPASPSPDDVTWADFDGDFTTPDDDPPVPNHGLTRRPAIRRRLRASTLPSGPRMTEREWEEIDKRQDSLYDFSIQPTARTDLPVAESQPSSGVVRSKTAPTAPATASPRMILEDNGKPYLPAAGPSRMVLEDDDNEYVPEARARIRKRDKLKSIGTRLASKFKKLSGA